MSLCLHKLYGGCQISSSVWRRKTTSAQQAATCAVLPTPCPLPKLHCEGLLTRWRTGLETTPGEHLCAVSLFALRGSNDDSSSGWLPAAWSHAQVSVRSTHCQSCLASTR